MLRGGSLRLEQIEDSKWQSDAVLEDFGCAFGRVRDESLGHTKNTFQPEWTDTDVVDRPADFHLQGAAERAGGEPEDATQIAARMA